MWLQYILHITYFSSVSATNVFSNEKILKEVPKPENTLPEENLQRDYTGDFPSRGLWCGKGRARGDFV